MRARLRRLLDLIVEPPRTYTGRHTTRTPTPAAPLNGFAVETWVWDTWADIATRHGIEDH